MQPSDPQENCRWCGLSIPIAVLLQHLRECCEDMQSPQQPASHLRRSTSEDDDHILPALVLSGQDGGVSDDDFQSSTSIGRHIKVTGIYLGVKTKVCRIVHPYCHHVHQASALQRIF